jgi:hypothetical protein
VILGKYDVYFLFVRRHKNVIPLFLAMGFIDTAQLIKYRTDPLRYFCFVGLITLGGTYLLPKKNMF